MSDQPANPTPPPAYGSVAENPSPAGFAPPPASYAPPPDSGTAPAAPIAAGYPPTTGPLPPYSTPQPGVMPQGPYPNEPPPKYEPSDKPMPPPGAFQGGYPAGGYPTGGYPAGGYPAGYQTGPVTQQAVIVAQDPGYSAIPKTMQCPYCRSLITTGTKHQPGGLSWLACGLLCLFGCWMGCCLIPFCMDDLQDVEHTCPNCGKTVGVHHRL